MNRSPPRVDRSPPRLVRAATLPVVAPPHPPKRAHDSSATAAGGGGHHPPKKQDTHVRVIVRIRPMNRDEAKGSRVCLRAEVPAASSSSSSSSGAAAAATSHIPSPKLSALQAASSSFPGGVLVGGLLGRLAATTTPGRAKEGRDGGTEDGRFEALDAEDGLDHGMILLDDDRRLTPTPGRLLLSPHYSSSPMRATNTTTTHASTTVLVDHHGPPSSSQSAAAPKRFTVDQVFSPAATQQQLYESVGDVAAVFRGYNVTILAYGQTASGKTHTMMGTDRDGVIPLAMHDLLSQPRRQHASVHLSCMEIYQDELKDLLVGAGTGPRHLKLRDANRGGGVRVQGLTSVKVETADHVLALLDAAQDRRRTGATRLNERSSRSHMIISLAVNNASVNPPVSARLTLVDLAGSERIKQTEVAGAALGESIHINTDLFALGKVVNSLCEKSPHVPYRDSKLTRLLKDALGGNCSTTLICCVSPSEMYLDESVNTLRYAERARSITNSLEKNVATKTLSPFEVAELRAENKRLRAQVVEFQRQLKGPGLQVLLDKMQKAQELGCSVRQNSHLVSMQADRLMEHVQQRSHGAAAAGAGASPASDSRSLLEYELSFTGDDEDSLVDPSDVDSLVSADTPTRNKTLAVEVGALQKEKVALKEMLLNISNQIEAKREDLEQLEDDNERQTKLRDELAVEVSQMKQRLHLLATGEPEATTGLLGLLRRPSAADAAGGAASEVEMRTMKVKEAESMTLARELAKSLAEERTRREELESMYQELELQAEQSRSHSEALLGRNQALQMEVDRLRGLLDGKVTPTTASPTSSEDTLGLENLYGEEVNEAGATSEAQDVRRSESSDEREGPQSELMKNKVREILRFASHGRGLESSGTCGSMVSSLGTALLPEHDDENTGINSSNRLGKFYISNIHDANVCTCEAAMFATNAEHVEFYLPILGVSCSCGKKQPWPAQAASNSNPCALECILRPWQVEFLQSVGIRGAVDFVHAFNERGVVLAAQMRKWRQRKGMLAVKTKSCRVALHIWQQTCKSVIRHVREQQARGVTQVQRPDFLEITVSDQHTVSTLGGGSVCNKIPLNVSTLPF